MSVRIIQGNALALPLADNSVDLVVTSPPYFGLRSYKDGGEEAEGQLGAETTPNEFVDALLKATREMVRVTKPTGSIWVNLGDKYSGYNNGSGRGRDLTDPSRSEVRMRDLGAEANPNTYGIPNKSLMGIPWRYALRCIDELGLLLRAEVIWSKANGMPESVTDRVRRSHEQWFHFTLQPRYFASIDNIREEYVSNPAKGNPLGRVPGSVWQVPAGQLRVPKSLGIKHFAAYPTEWPRRIIEGWCPEGGTVLDPFGGSGTTALAADVLGRDAITVDLSADYCRLAEWRINDSKQRERVSVR